MDYSKKYEFEISLASRFYFKLIKLKCQSCLELVKKSFVCFLAPDIIVPDNVVRLEVDHDENMNPVQVWSIFLGFK